MLNEFAEKFGLERVEGKQHVDGLRSGTAYEIDGKGFRDGGAGFVIVEARRFTTSRQSQERIGGLAYRIMDTGADGGIIVSPLGLQEGAEKVAVAEGIVNVRLDQDSTKFEYVLQFLRDVMVGFHDVVSVTDALGMELREADGAVKERRGPSKEAAARDRWAGRPKSFNG